jgi:hypothetical protein
MCLPTYSIQASAQLEIESKEKYVRKLVKNEKDAIAERDAALKQLSGMEEFEQRAKRAEESLKALNDHLRVEKEKYESFVEESSKVGVAEVNIIKIMTAILLIIILIALISHPHVVVCYLFLFRFQQSWTNTKPRTGASKLECFIWKKTYLKLGKTTKNS